MSLTQIRDAIGQLTEDEQIELAEWLRESLPHEGNDVYLQETIAIAERRSEELRSGKVKGVPWEEVKARLDAALQS